MKNRASFSSLVASLGLAALLGAWAGACDASGGAASAASASAATATPPAASAAPAATAAPSGSDAAASASAAPEPAPSAAESAVGASASAAPASGSAAAPPSATVRGTPSGAPAADTSASPSALAKWGCGLKGQPACPMQGWMKGVMGRALAAGDPDKLAQALTTVASKPVAGFSQWAAISAEGAAKAKGGDIDGAKESCKKCHALYQKKYQETMRDKPW